MKSLKKIVNMFIFLMQKIKKIYDFTFNFGALIDFVRFTRLAKK